MIVARRRQSLAAERVEASRLVDQAMQRQHSLPVAGGERDAQLHSIARPRTTRGEPRPTSREVLVQRSCALRSQLLAGVRAGLGAGQDSSAQGSSATIDL